MLYKNVFIKKTVKSCFPYINGKYYAKILKGKIDKAFFTSRCTKLIFLYSGAHEYFQDKAGGFYLDFLILRPRKSGNAFTLIFFVLMFYFYYSQLYFFHEKSLTVHNGTQASRKEVLASMLR